MNWLSDLWFDVRMAWQGFRFDRQLHKDWLEDYKRQEDLQRMREKGL